MSFSAPAAYDRFMGKYSSLLAPQLADLAGVRSGHRALDVGCGPGALTSELVSRLGSSAVSAVDPSEPFVAAIRERCPGVDVRSATAEDLPFSDRVFDVSLAQLVVHFMESPVAGLGEMRRVTRPDGVVAACVWDFAGEQGPLGPFWRTARELDPEVEGEWQLPGAGHGDLAELFAEAGFRAVEETSLEVSVEHQTFEEWWEPFTLGVGPAGIHVASLDSKGRAELREANRANLPVVPFVVTAQAWAARGTV